MVVWVRAPAIEDLKEAEEFCPQIKEDPIPIAAPQGMDLASSSFPENVDGNSSINAPVIKNARSVAAPSCAELKNPLLLDVLGVGSREVFKVRKG